jgi:hypothetical protein
VQSAAAEPRAPETNKVEGKSDLTRHSEGLGLGLPVVQPVPVLPSQGKVEAHKVEAHPGGNSKSTGVKLDAVIAEASALLASLAAGTTPAPAQEPSPAAAKPLPVVTPVAPVTPVSAVTQPVKPAPTAALTLPSLNAALAGLGLGQ